MSNWIACKERKPPKTGLYPAMSAHPDRKPPEDWLDALCQFDADAKPGKVEWQHSSGLYDGLITHWMELPLPVSVGEEPSTLLSGSDTGDEV